MENISIYLEYKNYKLDIVLTNKITVVVGMSGTGKSTMHKILTRINTERKQGKINISDNRFRLTYISNEDSFMDRIHEDKLPADRVYIIDEGNINIDHYIASVIQNTVDSYFIFTTRDSICTLNYDMDSVMELVQLKNGITTFEKYIKSYTKTADNFKVPELANILIEDSGKAQEWFDKVFESIGIKTKTTYGKDSFCDELSKELRHNYSNTLVIMDKCSFGCHVHRFKGIIDVYGSKIFMLSGYKSWEYLILNSNMYKDSFAPYTVSIPLFEEAYYEAELERVSSNNGDCSRYTRVKHDTQATLKQCYLDPCCAYRDVRRSGCNFGLQGDDKIVALLKDTIFHGILILAGRL